jgi:hypothetical protein
VPGGSATDQAPRSPALALGALFVGSLALRTAVLLAASRAAGWAPADLALVYDGHLYAILARTLPALYLGVDEIVPFVTTFRDPTFLTGWFPLYSILIRLADLLVGDLRWSALLVSQTASAAAVVAFHPLARRMLRRPWPATIAFAFFPPTWLVVGTFAFCEPVLILLAILAFTSHLRGRTGPAALWGGLAALTQKTGLLFLLVLGAATWLERRPERRRALAILACGFLPLALHQLYLLAVFGDPLVNLRVARERFVGGFGLPLVGLLTGLLSPDYMLPATASARRVLVSASALFYLTAGVLGWRDRHSTPPAVWLWLLGGLLLVFSMSGPWAYYAESRYALLAAPPALLVLARRLESAPPWLLWSGLACAVPFACWLAVADLQVGLELCVRVWSSRYFRALPAALE